MSNPTLHDPAAREALKRRVLALRPESPRVWGRMTIDQMLWHVSVPMKESLGEYQTPPELKPPIPKPLLRWLTLNMPWPRGAKTSPDLLAVARHDLEQVRAECLRLIDGVASRAPDDAWPVSGSFGRMTGTQWSRLHAKHLDHHLRQFGV